MPITIKQIAITDKEYTDVYNIREAVLRKPLNQSLKNDDLSKDGEDIILLAQDNETPIGCVMLKTIDSHTIKMRQMAVIDSYQGKGIGQQIVTVAEAAAIAADYTRIVLHARLVAAGFYEKLGYTQQGDLFEEVGIPHKLMQKSLI